MKSCDEKQFDTLIILDNGFDIWQGFNTSYSQFRKYYLNNRDEILKRLKLKPYDEEDILSDFYPCLPELKRLGKCETDVHWHISYHSDKDREIIKQVMQEIGCTNYTLYSTIDECLSKFKRK